ncbi:MAG: hypothetical protein RLY20_570 [Verrucomicrobiota bacterium]
MILKLNLRSALAALVFCLGATGVFGGNIIPLSVEELSVRAQLVLRGSVLTKSVQRDEAGRIYTRVELAITEVWKGNLSTNRFTVVHGGGVLGEQRARVSGQVEFSVGEEVVAFLVRNSRGEGVCLGLAQGKFEVWRDAVSGEKFARNSAMNGPSPALAARGNKVTASMASDKGRLTVADLKQRVEAVGK